MKKYLLVTVLLSLAACNYSTSPDTGSNTETKEVNSDVAASEPDKDNGIQDNGADTTQEVILKNGLGYDGAIFIATSKQNKSQNENEGSMKMGAPSTDSAYTAPGVFISAPIFPNTQLLYANEGNKYPVKYDQLQELAQNGHYNFDFLINECIQYPEYQDRITLSEEGVDITETQIRSNYNAVAQCSYEYFAGKPYFIPQLLEDVDLCKMHAGENFRMLTEADIQSFSNEFYADLAHVLLNVTSESEGNDWWGDVYFNLVTYIKDSEGRVKFGNMLPDVTERVVDINRPKKYRIQDEKTLRCINDNRS